MWPKDKPFPTLLVVVNMRRVGGRGERGHKPCPPPSPCIWCQCAKLHLNEWWHCKAKIISLDHWEPQVRKPWFLIPDNVGVAVVIQQYSVRVQRYTHCFWWYFSCSWKYWKYFLCGLDLEISQSPRVAPTVLCLLDILTKRKPAWNCFI